MTRFERLFAWLGGAVFVASLAYCAYAFVIRWSAPHAVAPRALVFDTLVFSVFAVHHSVFARPRVKDWLSRLVPDRMLRSVYVWTASLLFIGVSASWQPVGGSVYRHSGWLGLVHAFVQLLGVSLIARSVKTINPLELAGIRQVSPTSTTSTTSTTPGPTIGAELQIAGPYRLVRHPLYLGWILIVFGPALMTGDRLAFAAITTAYLAIAIPWEERARRRVRRGIPALSAARALAHHPVHLLKRESSSLPPSTPSHHPHPRRARRGSAPPPFSMKTIECCDGMSNFLPHVLQVTASSTRIM